MTLIELARCNLAMWLDGLKDRIDRLGEIVSPASEVWERYDEYDERRGYYDWYKLDENEPKC